MASFLQQMTKEAQSVELIDQALGLLQDGAQVDHLPVAPLYSAMKRLTPVEAASYLPQLSAQQRRAFFDLDLWVKDEIAPDQMDFWMLTYGALQDEDLIYEFVTSNQFQLYLKGRLNIWTFDSEDPQYPDHDYYFITDDQQLLFEYDQDFAFVEELKRFLMVLYSRLGVENAYSYLFKMINDSFMVLQEQEYQDKNERLRDLGFVDYFEALELLSPLTHVESIPSYLKKRRGITGEVFSEHETQNLMGEVVLHAQEEFKDIGADLVEVESSDRIKFIRFNFIRLVNAAIVLESGHGSSSLARRRTLKKASFLVRLGMEYARAQFGDLHRDILHEWDFFDLYKVGATLCRVPLSLLKKSLNQFDSDEGLGPDFLGDELNRIINNLFSLPPRFPQDNDFSEVKNLENYHCWREWCERSSAMVLMAKRFSDAYAKAKGSENLQFLNYDENEIHFELLFLSSIVRQVLNNDEARGLTRDDFIRFLEQFYDHDKKVFTTNFYQSLKDTPVIKEVKVDIFPYLEILFKNYLEEMDYRSLTSDEWKHIGGVLLREEKTN